MAGPLPDPVGSKTQDWLRGTPTEIGGATAGSRKGAPSLPEGRGRLLRPCALSRRREKSLLQRVPMARWRAHRDVSQTRGRTSCQTGSGRTEGGARGAERGAGEGRAANGGVLPCLHWGRGQGWGDWHFIRPPPAATAVGGLRVGRGGKRSERAPGAAGLPGADEGVWAGAREAQREPLWKNGAGAFCSRHRDALPLGAGFASSGALSLAIDTPFQW